MRLTDEERQIADDVAMHWAYTLHKLDDAWARALEHIAARRKALGEADDGEETLPDGVLATLGRLHRAAIRLYGHAWSCDTLTPAEQAEAWAALRDALHLPPGTATAAGVGGDAEAADQLQPGDYVLATKWCDGDPGDHFVVGYLANPPKLARNNDRWMVVDDKGIPFRANGFRRAEKITQDEGQAILAIMPQIANVEGPSLWQHLARIRGEKASTPATAAGVAAPPAEETSDEVVAWCVDGGTRPVAPRVTEDLRYASVLALQFGGTVVALVRQGSPRGVVVTEAQRKAVAVAASVYRVTGWKDRVTGWQEVADELDGLLAAIDAAKGGGA